MKNLGPLHYSDIEIIDAYQWIKKQVAAAMRDGRDTEKYRTPLKEIGTELNNRISATLCHVDDLLTK